MKLCSKCQLNNMDHVTTCIECGADLNRVGNNDIEKNNISPPRAGKLKNFRLFFYKIQRNLGSLQPDKKRINIPWVSTLIFLMSIIPGAAYPLQERLKRFLIVLPCYIFLLLFGIFFYGRLSSNIAFGLMVAIHIISIYDSLPLSITYFEGLTNRLMTMLTILIVVFLAYWGIYTQINKRIYGVWITFNIQNDSFSTGDFLLIKRSTNYRRGDIIFYYFQGQYGQQYDIRRGLFIDRIIGMPGEAVEITEDKIFINSKPLDEKYYPLQKVKMHPMKYILGENDYFVYDSITNIPNNFPIDLLLLHNVVSKDTIRGKVFMIYAPFARMGLIQ